jgi:hypothetical protein
MYHQGYKRELKKFIFVFCHNCFILIKTIGIAPIVAMTSLDRKSKAETSLLYFRFSPESYENDVFGRSSDLFRFNRLPAYG